ncbi:MFS transporter, FHS family, L-fucose permease [Lutibacter agarilyticus]|uniref:MFS transporter, FHS family, L-fucose permease n=1 Tax=Lutibacter agarilyticus TaxID=1109740 RepID=A0A238X064_9FLAO|nr:L-fucose:H+ symporter permease [Lutibacter agarilyticus]SNR51239.1 MFS transporter, FHS family, L-fucose permease [Lutibacter agarilyticus]
MPNKTKVPVVPKQLIGSFILITSLFALWGFANAVTDPMVQAFKKVLELTNSESAWVQMAFYGGYFCMALPASYFIQKYSYKTGILIGLGLYALGALLFYPAATYQEFWFFCLGLYILTFGLAFLETTANPYILAMGSKETATQRLNLAQAFNPLGLVLGLLVAKYFVLKNLQSDSIDNFAGLEEAKKALIRASDLIVIRNPYVILGLVVLLFFVLILLFKMPQIKGEEGLSFKETFVMLLKKKKYTLGVLSQVLYVGGQIMCWTYIYQYAESKGISNSIAANYQFFAFIIFLVGRAIGTYLLSFINSGKLLMIFSIGAVICMLITIGNSGITGMYSLVAASLFMSVMFPTIYGIALEGLNEEESKIGAAGLVMAIVGGAIMPKMQGMIIDIGGSGVNDSQIFGISEVNISFILPLICFFFIALYGKWITVRFNKTT